MSGFILIVRDMEGQLAFDAADLCEIVAHLSGVRNCRQGDDVSGLIECDFLTAEDATVIHVPYAPRAVAIRGLGEASLQAALELQQRLSYPIKAVLAHHPSYYADLSEMTSVQVLREKLQL